MFFETETSRGRSSTLLPQAPLNNNLLPPSAVISHLTLLALQLAKERKEQF